MHTLTDLRTGALAGARRLDLACGLTTLPREVFDLADTLEVLNLSGNQLSTLPDDLPRLHRLRVVFCSDNAFTTLPGVLGSCGQLEMVGFKANRIAHVPAESLPPRLRWLILTDNAVETLPERISTTGNITNPTRPNCIPKNSPTVRNDHPWVATARTNWKRNEAQSCW